MNPPRSGSANRLTPPTGPPLVALVSSRLGQDISRHRRVAAFLDRSADETRRRGGRWLVAAGSAIAPWAQRAAELFQVPITWLADEAHAGDVRHRDRNLGRDDAVIAMADRVDAVYARRGGTIARGLAQRLQSDRNATVRVAVWPEKQSADAALIVQGAIGWYLPPPSRPAPTPIDGKQRWQIADPDEQSDLDHEPWLVHCTRGVHGPWLGETERQYRDSILLAGGDGGDPSRRDPIDSLIRIIQTQRLIGSSVASSRTDPVVCFSACRLVDLLDRRQYRSHLMRWDYEPYGILIRKSAAIAAGARPVIYGDPSIKRRLPPAQRYRHHPPGKTHDWKSEREWRFLGSIDLASLAAEDLRVFCRDTQENRRRLRRCPWPVIWTSLKNPCG